jgi:hypothetical protein
MRLAKKRDGVDKISVIGKSINESISLIYLMAYNKKNNNGEIK